MQTEQQGIPYYEQWLGPWAMLADSFLQTFDLFRKTDLHLHMEAQQARQMAGSRTLTQTQGTVAVIDLTGKLMKQEASMGGGTSTVAARQAIRAAARSPDVSAIMLRIDSPGGTAAGTQELANEIAVAGKQKPVWAYAEDMAASAAYWAASQASKIIANPTAIVGSIGTYGVVQDTSGMAAMEGVKVHVIRAGAHKGAGTPGTEVTADHLADMQRIVDGLNQHFLAGVQSGRGGKIANLEEIADGRAHLAADALNMGLIDEVDSFDSALVKLQTLASKRRNTMQASLPGSAVDAALTVEIQSPPVVASAPVTAPVVATATPQPATYAELKAGLPGADAAFICSQLESSATIAAAQSAWMAEQNKRIEAAQQRPGVDAVGTKPSAKQSVGIGAVSAWEALIAAEMLTGKTRQQATKICVTNNPEAHLAYLAEFNAGVKIE